MKILAIDSSAVSASCCVWEDGRLLAQSAVNTRLTHSQTLLPMVRDMLQNACLTLAEMDLLAVAAGPGSFTGVRIGVAAVKGLALPEDKPCAGVSTLAAIAQNAGGLPFDGIVCAAMDARCQQVYAALFERRGGALTRLTPDEALPLSELQTRLEQTKKSIFLVGDGANLCYTQLKESVPGCVLSPPHLRYQSAYGVAAEAAAMAKRGETVSGDMLLPHYLRLPQAERELRARQNREVK